jgi:aspartyl-tRNA(Asn)/glutamyl-tRNA(Gln) amidotransferase subunit A
MIMDMSRRDFIQTTASMAAYLGLGLDLHANLTGDDLAFLTISQLSELIRTKKTSPVEVTRVMLQHIEKLNPILNAYITVTSDEAMKSAQNAEKEIQQGKWRGSLHGVPLALKDLFDTAGVRTTAASAVFKNRVPQQDAEVVRRLKAAGAVLLGKLNMHEFAYGGTSIISYFGPVHNPWGPTYSPGGSSGGSAAAVAAGLCFGALGSDTGGSIRIPAAYCGTVGLKPTYGLVSTRGVIPLSWSTDHVGPMTRSVADAAILLKAIAGYDPDETTSVQIKGDDYSVALQRHVPKMRLGVPHGFFFADLHPEIQTAMGGALAVLEQLTGGQARDVEMDAALADQIRVTIRAAEAYAYHAEFVAKNPSLYQPYTLARIKTGADIGTVAYIQARRQLDQVRHAIAEVFQTVDILVTPTTQIPPLVIAEVPTDPNAAIALEKPLTRNTSPFDAYGLPTISVPCGFTSTGLPIGLQLSGPHGGEAVVLQLAHAYEQATEWHRKRPTIS